jgi:hypothetical protein
VTVPLVQTALPQEVPAAATRQWPAPSHLPVVPHALADVVQLSASAAPSPTFAHTPLAFAQVWHVPQLAVVQQVPSTQLPEVHSSSWPQVEPFAFRPGPQAPLRQTLPGAQSAVVEQRCRHAPDLQV